jgi:hypothetical protein
MKQSWRRTSNEIPFLYSIMKTEKKTNKEVL